MKKKVFGKKFSRGRGARKALYRSQLKALVENGRIVTTKVKAKALRAKADRVITLAKVNSVTGRRRLVAYLGNDVKTTKALFESIAPKFNDRKSGFTRLITLSRRKGDNAQMARLEWVKEIVTSEKREAVKGKKKPETKEAEKIKRGIRFPKRNKDKKESTKVDVKK